MALSEIDRKLLQRCLAHKPRAWEDFVDRFMGLVIHVINHTASARSNRLSAEDREDLCADVLLAIIKDDAAILRHFRGQSSLATYLTVVVRRIVVRSLLKNKSAARLTDSYQNQLAREAESQDDGSVQRISDQEEVQRLIELLDPADAEVVRLFHLEGKSYQQISDTLSMPENSIGPTLSRAREKMRRISADTPTS